MVTKETEKNMATDTDSVHENMTRLRMKMVQQKIANEREKLNRPSSEAKMAQVKHVIEHTVATPKQYHLPPLQGAPQPPQPQITMGTPPQHIIQQIPVPQPVIQNLVPEQNQNKGSWFNKADFMEMMMMQNAQMHHMVMQQMMIQSLPGLNTNAARTYPVSVITEPAAPMVMSRPAAGVHHHHYQMTPPMASAPPMINHYASLPPLDARIGSPMRVRTTPGNQYYSEDGSNYYFSEELLESENTLLNFYTVVVMFHKSWLIVRLFINVALYIKIANEREKLNRPSSEASTDVDEEANQIKLQQAMLRRQELLDKIKQEQYMNEDYRRPRSYSARRRYTPSPLPPPTRRSLPDFNRNYYNKPPEPTYRNNSYRNNSFRGGVNGYDTKPEEMAQVKHVIEHTVATPKQYHLPPLQGAPQPPQPQITMGTPPQHIIQQIPTLWK
ncbi:hypothetical protein KUTeg_015062 [Tegillarca granosa]|uniref:DUF4587 domain-containing protein n=1 Tax=Tegillarca granosa TaxID=220873 RepID=A0ABQ9EP15_TEGGR|nr:hypothetical protein KUTeg_015062 [Tegillarca granosa]